MNEEGLKNKISMALKDPILQQGFEIICKELEELEKENAELKGIKDVATLIRANNDTVTTLMQLNNMLVSRNQQLTKAKKLLKWFVWYFREDYNNVPYKHKVKEAEQFLNSEVEND